MKMFNGDKYLKIGVVAKLLERSPLTIKIWYEYAENEGIELPKYLSNLDARKSRFWKESDIPELIKFRDSIEKGTMSKTTVYKWGKRGEAILKKGSAYGTKRLDKIEEKK